MQRIRTPLQVLALAAIAVPLTLANPPAQAAKPDLAVAALTYHLDTGTSILTFDNTTKPGQYLRFEVDPMTDAGSATITASNLAYSGDWSITTNDVLAATHSMQVVVTPNYNDFASSTVAIANGQTVNFFQLPVDTFGPEFSFDISETGVATGAPTDFIVYANDDPIKINGSAIHPRQRPSRPGERGPRRQHRRHKRHAWPHS